MAFTTRANGSGEVNRIKAAWFNDFVDWFTGVMTDQPVTPKSRITNKAKVAKPSSPCSAAAVSGAGLSIGVYKYRVAFTDANGSTLAGTATTVTTTTGNQKVNLSSIPTGGTGTTKRTIFRTKVGASIYYVLTTINDNSTTTFADTTADASLTVLYTDYATMGGAYEAMDDAGVVQASISPDGQVRGKALWANPQPTNGQEPLVDIAIGDNDTGLKWVSDGVFDLYANGVVIARIQASGATGSNAPIASVAGGTGRIFIQGSAPSSPQDGDIWIDTSVNLG